MEKRSKDDDDDFRIGEVVVELHKILFRHQLVLLKRFVD
jgi:hypothetical protein